MKSVSSLCVGGATIFLFIKIQEGNEFIVLNSTLIHEYCQIPSNSPTISFYTGLKQEASRMLLTNHPKANIKALLQPVLKKNV